MRGLVVSTMVGVLMLGAVPALAGDGPGARRRQQAREFAIYNRALREVQQANPSCRKLVYPHRPATHAAPDAALLSTLGVLRRPANDGDRTLDVGFEGPILRGAGVFSDYVRLARVAFGASFYVVPVQDTRGYPHPSARCLKLDRRQLDHDLAALPARRRRAYARHLHTILGYQEHQLRHKPLEGAWLIDRSRGGGGGGTYTVAQLQRGAPFSGFWSPGHPVLVDGLLPDGVASITAIYRARTATVLSFPRPGHKPRRRRVHAPALTVNAPVVGNVVAFKVRRPGELSRPDLVQWLDAAGNVIRQVNGPS
jgi:type II secretory pathway pseudopilin PulG